MRLDTLVLRMIYTHKDRKLLRQGLDPLAPTRRTMYGPLRVRRKRWRKPRNEKRRRR